MSASPVRPTCWPLLTIALLLSAVGVRAAAQTTVTIDTTRIVRQVGPAPLLGGAIDAHDTGIVDALWNPAALTAMRSVGLTQLSYRLRTELSVAAWHWNPRGRWSDAARAQGYWVSDDQPGAPILASPGYDLPRRGNTFDQAGQHDWSRLTDGRTATFWKSNPYLAARYTGEPEAQHEQLVVLDLGRPQPVNALQIAWAAPWATTYIVERWVGDNALPADARPAGQWTAFPQGTVQHGRGGTVQHRLSASPLTTRWLRIRLLTSSHTALPGSRDPRDSLGFAIRELYAGRVDAAGHFTDLVRHRPSQRQSATWTSSTDPWHRARDRSPDLEHPGIDRVLQSGLVADSAIMWSVGALYDTPENAAALVRYLRARGHRVSQVEIGEEPDGQYVRAEDFGALYRQVGRALRAVDPALTLVGPSLQSTQLDVRFWPDTAMTTTWLQRFRAHLVEQGAADLLQAITFEWYPFDATCDPAGPQLARHRGVYERALARLTPPLTDLPWMLTEIGYSAFAGESEVTLAAAVLFADVIGRGLEHGLTRGYVYRWEPASLQPAPRCGTLGINAMHLVTDDLVLRDSTAMLQAVRLLQREWLPAAGDSAVLLATTVGQGAVEPERAAAYTLRRSSGEMRLLLTHHDTASTFTVRVPALGDREATITQYGPAQYAWRTAPAGGRTVRNTPPAQRVQRGASIELPPLSVTVVRWRP
ncbi:MAG: discoidin domain-containing protein [Gemmatimonadaceae bacterium]|nr:discoidin domain-containing protein [Gemmatimonadaceae bacterium]